ncbi:alpha/beta hydrolase [Falsibacillus albus]|uniref:alpha/beta hydrolase n=1 Tax=Falsibacillus albus TaxID=2478915 RepID=UPI0013150006|nr:alpha/beta hydrolase [Falsibacillus albus]
MKKHYSVITGSGKETNIFLPGTGWAGDFGRPIAESFNERFSTHMIDLPGIGRSEGLEGIVTLEDAANWLHAYINDNSIRKVNIIGHSLGGIIGMAYAQYYPEKVNSIVLLDIGFAKIDRFPVSMMGPSAYLLPIISVLHKWFGQKVLGTDTTNDDKIKPEATEEKIVSALHSYGLEDSPFMRTAIRNQQSTSLEGISLLLAAYRSNLPLIVKNLKMPCLLLYGNRNGKHPKYQKRIHRKTEKLKSENVLVRELNGEHYAHVSDDRAIEYITGFIGGSASF